MKPAPRGGRERTIFAAGPFPPPLHGMSAVNQQVASLLGRKAKVVVAPIGPGSRKGWRGHLFKARAIMLGFLRLVIVRLGGCRVLYVSFDDGLGGAWTAAMVGLARFMQMRVFVHYHSFRFVEHATGLMTLNARLGGKSATHIMLCDRMNRLMRATYPAISRSLVVPNTVAVPLREKPGRVVGHSPLVVGMLANLTLEKGVAEYLAALRMCWHAGAAVSGVLAGPADATARRLIEREVASGANIEWRGPVAGGDKERFFSEIDVFFFPTRYRTEAYPLVIVEALGRGVPVIATGKGCIPAFAALEACEVLDPESDYVRTASHLLAAFAHDAALLASRRAAAIREGAALIEENERRLNALVDEVLACA